MVALFFYEEDRLGVGFTRQESELIFTFSAIFLGFFVDKRHSFSLS